MKDYLQKLIARKQKELANLKKRNEESEDINEVKTIGSQIESVNAEINDAQAQLNEIEAEEKKEEEKESEEARSAFNPGKALNVVAGAKMNEARSEDVDTRSTMEYRKAFKDYIQRGVVNKEVLEFEQRASTGTSADLGVLIPTTVIQEIIKDVEKVYGSIYSKVKKTNLKGGVKYPLGSFSATFNRITEAQGTSSRQHAGEVTGYVEFSYNIGEIRLARTLLEVVLSVEAFEREFAQVIASTYIEAMDKEIIRGVAANNQCEGILTEAAKVNSRIAADHVISFTAAEIADWTKWESKLFAQIPLSLENSFTEFVMAKQTYVSNLCTLKDNNNQPINKAGFDVTDKQYKFNEYPVNRVEKDIFKDFDSCADGEYFGMLWLPEKAYAINSNLDFYVVDYFDQETNQYVKKALVINDGKVLDPKYIYLLKKSVTA